MNQDQDMVIKDSYLRRFFIPVIITILLLCGIVVILTTPPGTPVKWNTFEQATSNISFPFSK